MQIGISNWFRALAAGDAPPRLGSRRPLNIRFYTAYPTCNLSCSYCIAGHGDKYPKPQSQWDEQRFLAIVENIRKLPYDVNIRLGVGGEFFVSKTLIDAARRLSHSGNVASVNLITNLTFSLKQYDRIFAGYRRDKVAVVASFHPTEIEDHEAWFDKAAGFHRRFDFAVVLVAFPDLLPDVPATKRKLEERGVQVFVQPYIGEHGGKSYPRDYSDEERALLRREMYSRHDYEFQVNLKRPGICHAGHRSVYVTPLGKVFPCGTGLYTEAFVLGDLSQSPDLRLRDSPAPCPFQACQCDTENVNTVDFETHYQRTGKNQHTYEYRFKDLAEQDERFAEWHVRY